MRDLFSSPTDAVVTETMLDSTPFAYMEARLGDAAQSVLVLGWQEHGEDKWLSAGNEMLVLRHGRVVRTLGLPIDRTFTGGGEPDPLAKLDDPAQLDGREWQSTLDWNDSHGAGFIARARFLDHGISRVSLRGSEGQTLRLIEERVNLRPAGSQYSNWYYVNERGLIVKSRQHVHPDQPPLTLLVVRNPGPSTPGTAKETITPSTVPRGDQVRVTLSDGNVLALPAGARRLSEVLLRAHEGADPWWPGSRLYRTDTAAQQSVRTARVELVEKLKAFAEAAEQRGNPERAQAVRALVDRLPPPPPGEMLPVVLDLDRLRLTPALDVMLPPGEYHFVQSPRPETLTLVGMAAHPGERGLIPGRSIAGYVDAEPLTAGANRDNVWLVQPNGTIRQVPVAGWNREFALPQPGATLMVGISGNTWRRDVPRLNQALAALYAAQPPLGNASRAVAVVEMRR